MTVTQRTSRRRLTVAAGIAALALALSGCSGGGGHTLGDSVDTKLEGSTFTGNVSIRATRLERVTDAALAQFGLSGKGETAYLAHATVRVVRGTFPASAARDFGNTAWGLDADNALQAGPALAQSDRSALLQRACPFRPADVARTLREGHTARVCAVLLGPKGGDVTGVSYLRADDQDSNGTTTITWTAN